MRYRKLGEAEIEVSEVGFGLWTLSAPWWKPPDEASAIALLKQAYDAGITYYETGPYGHGVGEGLLGKAFGERREMIILGATAPANPAGIRFAVQASLQRLGSTYLDLLFIENPTMAVLQDNALFAGLDALKDEGLIRYWGISMGPGVGHYDEGMAAIKKRFATAVGHAFNVLEQDPGRKFFTASLEGNTGNVVRGAHASGPMAGTYDPAFSLIDPTAPAPRRPDFLRWAEAAAKSLAWIHEGHGMTIGQAAIKFCLSEETVSTVLPDIRTAGQLAEYTEAPDKDDYSQQDVAEIAERYRQAFGTPRPG